MARIRALRSFLTGVACVVVVLGGGVFLPAESSARQLSDGLGRERPARCDVGASTEAAIRHVEDSDHGAVGSDCKYDVSSYERFARSAVEEGARDRPPLRLRLRSDAAQVEIGKRVASVVSCAECQVRVRDAVTGVLQRDPSGYSDSVNLYAAFRLDPINKRDPSGNEVDPDALEHAIALAQRARADAATAEAQATLAELRASTARLEYCLESARRDLPPVVSYEFAATTALERCTLSMRDVVSVWGVEMLAGTLALNVGVYGLGAGVTFTAGQVGAGLGLRAVAAGILGCDPDEVVCALQVDLLTAGIGYGLARGASGGMSLIRANKTSARQRGMLNLGGGKQLLPGLRVNTKQFGKKIGKHAEDFGLDPSNPSHRHVLRTFIEDIVRRPEAVRQGPFNPRGGGGSDYLFFRHGNIVVLTDASGEFVTILTDGHLNSWYLNARALF